MKLELDSKTSAPTIAENDFLNETGDTADQIDLTELLNEGIKAAQSGRRAEARSFLLTVTESEPDNEAAWLWLASISEYPEELLGFLNNVLGINPENERAETWRDGTKSLLSKTFVQRGIDASRKNRKDFAKQCFRQALHHNEQSDMAWLWLAACTDSEDEKKGYFEKVLEIDPENEQARGSLDTFRRQAAEQLWQQAFDAAKEGENKRSANLLDEVMNLDAQHENVWILKSYLAKSFAEKLECLEKVLEFNPENKLADANVKFLRGIKPAEVEEQNEPVAEANEVNSAAQIEEDFFEEKMQTDELEFPKEAAAKENVFESDEMFEAEHVAAAEESEPVYASFDAEEMEEASAEFAESEPEYTEEFEAGDFAENESPAAEFEDAEDLQQVCAFEEPQNSEPVKADEHSAEARADEVENALEIGMQAAEQPVEDVDDPEKFESGFQSAEIVICPFCEAENEAQTFACGACCAVYSLSDLEMLLAPQNVNKEAVTDAVQLTEAEAPLRDLDADELKFLAVGYFNLEEPQKGISYLSEAARMNPDDILLGSQLNALKIRLSEIGQKQNHDSMPKNMTILVADDSATVRKLISAKLEKCGHQVVLAIDGVDAIEKLKEIEPDLVLLDINMPRMDGYQVCKHIRGNEATKDVPVVMISGKDGFFDKVRGRMAGTTGYITKPFGPETLMKTVETYVLQPA
jgi:CheY-like chemotaxis protein